MFERCTEEFRRAVFFARHEALLRQWQSIEPEHLALGMLYEETPALHRAWPPGVATPPEVKGGLEAALAAVRGYEAPTDIPLSAEAKAAIRASAAASERFGHAEVGLGHLLLGLVTYERTLWSRIAGGFALQGHLRRQGFEPRIVEAHARTTGTKH